MTDTPNSTQPQQDFDCQFYPQCHIAYDLLYCPKKAKGETCIDYVSLSRPHTPTPTLPDDAIGALISENARIGSELKRMTKKAEFLSGEHDTAIRKAERMGLLKELQKFIDNADSRIGCPHGTLGTAYLVQWMGGQGHDCD